MTGLSLASKGVICGGNISGPPPIIGGGGGPIRKQEEIIMPKIKVLNLDISKDITKYDVDIQSVKSVF